MLRDKYETAPAREKAMNVVLFGIENADALGGQSIADVAEQSGIGKWGPPVALGCKLAQYVELKNDP